MDFYLEGKQCQTNEVRKQPQNRIMQSKSFGIPRQLIKKEDLILFSRPLVDGGWWMEKSIGSSPFFVLCFLAIHFHESRHVIKLLMLCLFARIPDGISC